MTTVWSIGVVVGEDSSVSGSDVGATEVVWVGVCVCSSAVCGME
jgi:hypothetical protein